MTKKASDIILELKDQVLFLTKLVTNQDNNIKLILQKINDLKKIQNVDTLAYVKEKNDIDNYNFDENIADHEVIIPKSSEIKHLQGEDSLILKYQHAQQENKKSKFEQMKSQIGIIDSETDGLLEGIVKNNDLSPDKLQEATSFIGKRRGQRADRESGPSTVLVSQQLLGLDGKPLALATVKITDSMGKTITSSKSNTKGIWHTSLSPGNYTIYVLKRFLVTPEKKGVETSYPISVTISDSGKMELPPITL